MSHHFSSFAQGDIVAIFGAVGPSLGPYGIKIDGQSMGTFNATKQNYAAQMQLYHADDLGAGNHTLEIVNQPTSTGQGLALDFARVAGLPSAIPSSASSSASASASASALVSASSTATANSSKMPRCVFILSASSPTMYSCRVRSTFKVVGSIVAGVAAVCLVLSLVGLIYRQRNKRRERRLAVGRSMDVSAFMNGGMAISVISPVDAGSSNSNPESESETAHLLDPRSMTV